MRMMDEDLVASEKGLGQKRGRLCWRWLDRIKKKKVNSSPDSMYCLM